MRKAITLAALLMAAASASAQTDSGNGIVFQPWEQDTLETAITMSMARDWDYAGIASKALQRFAPSTHLETLMRDIYQI
jgi:hypothetical protein